MTDQRGPEVHPLPPVEAARPTGTSRPSAQGRRPVVEPERRNPPADPTFVPMQPDALAPGSIRPDPVLSPEMVEHIESETAKPVDVQALGRPRDQLTPENIEDLEMVKSAVEKQAITQEQFAITSAMSGIAQEETQYLLQNVFGLTQEDAQKVIGKDEIQKAFREHQEQVTANGGVEPAPEFEDEGPTTPEERAERQEEGDVLEELKDLKHRMDQGGDHAPKKEEVKQIVKKAKGAYWKGVGRRGGIGIGYSILGAILLFVALLSVHGGGKG